MNRFLTRRKERAVDDAGSGGGWRGKKGKKAQPEPEPKVDIAMALPSSDDFRTSLIMPSLSTRFSMLREQDDPSSKLGKASDDSVLHPKRQSRLHEFGFVPGGLSDIAEVSSINGSIRPPFATERQNSFDSHNTEDGSGSMMSRARPGEGNVLFGGRQKIYKISNTGSSKTLGKVLYEDDVHMSAFQKMRLQEKERLREQGLDPDDDAQLEPSSPTKDAYSPSLSGYSQRRETSSSTNSGTAPTRSSTAATSIASQGANSIPVSSPALPSAAPPLSPTSELSRSTTKTRRLYDQALDQHMYDQQSSAMNRLNSIQRTRAPTGRSTPPLLYSQTRSATNLNDRFNRGVPFRTDSPTTFLNGKDTQSAGSSPIISRPQSPPLASPLGSDSDDAQTLNSALQPNDRGKATAMGAFNKPKQAFSEQQYAERLKQMQQDIPVPKLEKPRKPSLRERAEQEARKRAEAGVPDRLRSNSPVEKKEAPSAFSVFQSAANQMKSPDKALPPPPPKEPETAPQSVQSPDSQKGATFFASPGSSDDEEEPPKKPAAKPAEVERRLQNLPTASGPAPPILDHPAFARSRSNSHEEHSGRPALRSRSNSRAVPEQQNTPQVPQVPQPLPSATLHPESANKSEDPDIDSPTLGPGIGGLVRQHLRTISNVSSDYGDANQITTSPPATSTTVPLSLQTQLQRRQPTSETNTATHSGYSHSNPWDLDDLDNSYYGEGDSTSSTSPVEATRPKAQAPTNNGASSTTQVLDDTIAEWEKEMKKTHKREPSIEERDAFQRELAARQRAIQESLRSRNENNRSRNVSPAPAPGGGLKTALSMLRAKSSRESFATVDQKQQHELPPKAMKMLGLGANSNNASSASLPGPNGHNGHNGPVGPYGGDHWKSEDRVGLRDPPLRQKPSRVLQQSEQDAQREFEQRQRSGTQDSTREPRSHGRSPPASNSSSIRGRSSSEVSSGRSRSRPAQYRDDLEQAMMEGTGSRTTVYPPNNTPSVAGFAANTTQPLPAERPSLDSQGRMRSRSNSRTTAANYFESKHLQPIHTSHGPPNGASPRLSPAVGSPQPPFASPGLPASPRPSPGAPSPAFRPQASPVPPFSAHNTPPVSGTTTPVNPAFNTGAAAIIPSSGTLRKKSIAKADISEPIFLSTTSVIDTINLPAGASLRNGMDAPPPPVPPINPMRRRFGFGRSATDDPAIHMGAPSPPYADAMRTNSSDALASKIPQPRQRLRKTSSEGHSLHAKARETQSAGNSPAMPSMPFGRNGSPPRPINPQPIAQRNMEGGMF
jgi:hypothetical protein